MKNSNLELFELKSAWSRLIHRVHTLGVTQHVYKNVMAGLVEKRVYPRQVPSVKEDTCFSLDGTHLWRMSNWDKGWALVNSEESKASLVFASRNGGVFHRIELTSESQWDCLECLLKVFVRRQVNELRGLVESPPRKSPAPAAHSISNVTELIGKTVEEGRKIKCTMPVSGGLITRECSVDSMATRAGVVSLTADNSKLIIDSANVKHVDVNRNKSGFMGTFYNMMGVPQLILEAA